MLDLILDEFETVLNELGATLKELDARLERAYNVLLISIANRLYSFGYGVQGEEFEPYDPYDPENWQ